MLTWRFWEGRHGRLGVLFGGMNMKLCIRNLEWLVRMVYERVRIDTLKVERDISKSVSVLVI